MKSAQFLLIFFCILFIASFAISQENSADNDSLNTLINMLSHKDEAVREKAAVLLKDFKPPAKESVPHLERALEDENLNVRLAVSKALFELGSKLRLPRGAFLRIMQKIFHQGPELAAELPFLKDMGYVPISTEEAMKIFESFWTSVDREYAMFVIKPDVNWTKLHETFHPQISQVRSLQELWAIIGQMLYVLDDQHLSITLKGKRVKISDRRFVRNYNKNTKIYTNLVGELHQVSKSLVWAKTADDIGYIGILNWGEENLPEQIDSILEEMRNTRGLVIDVRMNTGGSEELARRAAGRFVEKEYVYAYHQYRNGANHTDLTRKIPRVISPRGPWHYNRPIALLIGNICLSANESFVAMMDVCPQVTTMGNATRGASGNPRAIKLHKDLQVNLSRWVAFLPNGDTFENKGIRPDLFFETKREKFSDDRDDLVSFALEHLRKEPLPDIPISGLSVQEIREKEENKGKLNPKVVQLEPVNQAKKVPSITDLKIQFDLPMHPTTISLQWKEGGIIECGQIQYDDSTNTFTIPVKLAPKCRHSIIINPEIDSCKSINFKSKYGKSAQSFEWNFHTKRDKNSKRAKTTADDNANLGKLITNINQKRSQLEILDVQVQTVQLGEPESKGFTKLMSYGSRFKFQEHCYFYADVSDYLGNPFYITGFCTECGYFLKSDSISQMVLCSWQNMHEKNIKIADHLIIKLRISHQSSKKKNCFMLVSMILPDT